jgi:hypothetical protein
MRKHIILFFSALLFLFACKPGDDSSGIINQDDMVRLLVDVHLIDGYLATQPNNDSLYKYGTGRFMYLFKQYHTDSAQFKKSMKYYTEHDEVLAKMYEEVNKILQKKSDSLLAVISKEQEIARKQGEKTQQRIAKLKEDSLKRKFQQDLKLIKLDSIKRAKKAAKEDSIKKAKALNSKKTLLKPKAKKNTTKIK